MIRWSTGKSERICTRCDAADVTMSRAFGSAQLVRFKVITDEFKDVGQDSLLKEAA